MSIRTQLRQFLDEADSIDDIAYQLWTWLPSYKLCEEDKGRDNTHHFIPPTEDIIRETCSVLAFLAGYIETFNTRPWWDDYKNGSERAERICTKMIRNEQSSSPPLV